MDKEIEPKIEPKLGDIFDLSDYIRNRNWAVKNGYTIEKIDNDENGKHRYCIILTSQPNIDQLSESKRIQRDELLQSTDKYMISDYPITTEERDKYIKYRIYLRNIPENENFPNLNILKFEDWDEETQAE